MMQRSVAFPVIKRTLATNTAHKIVSRDEPATQRRSLPKDNKVQSTRSSNGVMVVSLENNSPVSRVTAIFKAGSRYETSANAGVVHRIRNSVGLSSKKMTGIKLNHELAAAGGLVDCSATRDFLSYELHAPRNLLPSAMYHSITQMVIPKFLPFEVNEGRETLAIDHGTLRENYAAYVLDILHRAAYRTSPLANSMISPKRMIGKHSTDMLNAFVEAHFVSGNAALVGVGVNHEMLTEFAEKMFHLGKGSAVNTVPAKYGGGELRKEKGGHLAVVAVAAEGVSLKDPKAAAVQAVLGALLGVGPQVKWSEGGRSRLSKAVQGATSRPFFVTSFNLSYTDSGLFGVQYIGNHSDSGKIAKAVVGEFRKASKESANDADLKAAQARVKYNILALSECGHNTIEDLAVQTMVRPGSYVSPSELAKLVDGVTAGDVQEAAKKMLSSKLSMAALGNLANTPYLDEL